MPNTPKQKNKLKIGLVAYKKGAQIMQGVFGTFENEQKSK